MYSNVRNNLPSVIQLEQFLCPLLESHFNVSEYYAAAAAAFDFQCPFNVFPQLLFILD